MLNTGNDAQNSNSLKQMQQRVLGSNTSSKYDYSKLLEFINQYGSDGDIDKNERGTLASTLGLSNKEAKRLAADLNGKGNGLALYRFKNNANIRGYINKDGQWVQESFEDMKSDDAKKAFNDAYDAALFHGTNYNEVATRFNKAVDDWHKGDIYYDPISHRYYIRNFWDPNSVNNVAGSRVDITDSDWFKNDNDRKKTAQLRSYRNYVDLMLDDELTTNYSNKYNANNLATTLGISNNDLKTFNDSNTSAEDKQKFKDIQGAALKKHLDAMRTNPDGSFNFEGSVEADRILKYIIAQQKNNPNYYTFLDAVAFNPKSRYSLGNIQANPNKAWNYLEYKNGGSLKQRVLVKKAGLGDILDYFPIVGTIKQGIEMAKDPSRRTLGDWGSLALSGIGDILIFTGVGSGVGAAIKGSRAVTLAAKTLNKTSKAVRRTEKALTKANKTTNLSKNDLKRLANLNKQDLAKETQEVQKVVAKYKKYQNTVKASKNARKALNVAKQNKQDAWRRVYTPTLKRWNLGSRSFGLGIGATGRNYLAAKKAVLQQEALQNQDNPVSIGASPFANYLDDYSENYYDDTPIDTSEPSSTSINQEYSPYYSDNILVNGI